MSVKTKSGVMSLFVQACLTFNIFNAVNKNIHKTAKVMIGPYFFFTDGSLSLIRLVTVAMDLFYPSDGCFFN